MNNSQVAPKENRYILPVLLCLFVASGCAALIYEVVWYHLLRFVIGSSALSLGILLASFMGGMFIGSLLFHRFVAANQHPLKVYSLLELGIGLCGIAIPLILPFITRLYIDAAGYTAGGIAIRSLVCAIVLLPPTILMGATLPAISRWMKLTRTGYSRLGLFYSANIFGAVIGTSLAGFYLLRIYDVYIATSVAVILNIIIAIASYMLALRVPYQAAPVNVVNDKKKGLSFSPVYVVIALSGLTALGAQVVWTRLLSLLLGATVYTFSVILAIFLVGLGIGSALGSYCCQRFTNSARLLAIFQFMLVLAIPYAAFIIISVIPDLHFFNSQGSWLLNSADDLLRVALAILPATIFWGASFPVAVAAAGGNQQDPGRLVGHVYAANTVGAIAGALCFSVLIIPWIGTHNAQWLLTLCAGLASIIMVAILTLKKATVLVSTGFNQSRPYGAMAVAASVLVISFLAGLMIPATNPDIIAYGRERGRWDQTAEYMHVSEGRSASVAVSRIEYGGIKKMHVSGKVVASTLLDDMRIQRMLGHLPAMLHPEPKSVLIIGFGAGVTSGTFTLYPSIERIVIVEIEPEVPAAASIYFRKDNYNVFNDPRTELIYDDARHYITTTDEKFDLITTDPIHPWVKGAAALYTKEFYKLVKERLNPGGFITQWVPLYETSEEAVKSQVGTFFDIFPGGSVWNSDKNLIGYDVTLLGHVEPLLIKENFFKQQFKLNYRAQRSLAEVKIPSFMHLLGTYAGRQQDMASWLADYQPNLDRNLRLEYLAGSSLDIQDENEIYNAMTKHLKYPDDFILLEAAPERWLRSWLAKRYPLEQ